MNDNLRLLQSEASRDELVASPLIVSKGDCGIVLKPDGGFHAFTTGLALTDLQSIAGGREGVMAQKLVALCLALSNEQIMTLLLDLCKEPHVAGTIEMRVTHG